MNDMKIIVDHLTYKYNEGTDQIITALDDVSFVVRENEFIGIIGTTGSGKSTLVQHLNALITPSSGTVYYSGEDIFEKDYDRRKLRGKVGLVFQYPENQLFSDTVFEDVCFGPKNMGMDRKKTELRAYETLKMCGVDDECFYQSPFELSGGQKRRVAIAGVLAMKPEVLILDEPTAGLDPKGRDEILNCIKNIQENEKISVILVSHSMEDVANYADKILVLNKGKLVYFDTPENVFANVEDLEEIGLNPPEMTYIMRQLKNSGFDVNCNVLTVDEAKNAILKCLGK